MNTSDMYREQQKLTEEIARAESQSPQFKHVVLL